MGYKIFISRSAGKPAAYTIALVTTHQMRVAHAPDVGEAQLIAGEWMRGVYLVPGRVQRFR